ncbi:MAG: SDR family oxidoreductase [Calditrichia bacterium]
MKHVFITGTSTGIGYALARDLIKKGYSVTGTVRKQEDATRLSNDLGPSYTPLLCDVTREEDIQQAFIHVKDTLNNQPLTALINNAGIGYGGPLLHQPIEEIRRIFEVNLFGLLRVTQVFYPLLLPKSTSEQPGRIINIGSVAGKIGIPFLGGYVASKHALEGLSDSLRRELLLYGIPVILIEPGDTRTAIWDKGEQQDLNQYKDTDYLPVLKRFKQLFVSQGRGGMPVEKVTNIIISALESNHPKTRYAIPSKIVSGWLIPRYFPDQWVDKIMDRVIGITSKQNESM